MSMFTVVPFVHELKGKQASPAPPPPFLSLPLADHRARCAGPTGPGAGTAGWVAGGVGAGGGGDSAAKNPPECENTAIPSST